MDYKYYLIIFNLLIGGRELLGDMSLELSEFS